MLKTRDDIIIGSLKRLESKLNIIEAKRESKERLRIGRVNLNTAFSKTRFPIWLKITKMTNIMPRSRE
jgi:hypothetical protein